MNLKNQEQEMQSAYREQTEDVLQNLDRYQKAGTAVRIGLEAEVAVHKFWQTLDAIQRVRNAVLKDTNGVGDVELGAAQIEFRTPPIDCVSSGGFEALTAVYGKNYATVVAAAKNHGCSILRVGANPFLPVKNTPRTDRPKYRLVPDFYNQHRRGTVDTRIGLGKTLIDVGDAAVISVFQSFQINLEAYSASDACDKMNRSLMTGPYLLALAGNARYLKCLDTRILDTRINDVRMAAWEKSHDTQMQDIRVLAWEKTFDLRTPRELVAGRLLRVGLPERYFIDIADYLSRAGRFPFILFDPRSALNVAIGMTWLDTRVKFIEDSLVVELRILPTQPTLEEELLYTLLFVGRLTDSQQRHENLLPIHYVRENRLSAMLYGTHRGMWFVSDEGLCERLPYHVGIERELQRAQNGLRYLGMLPLIDHECLTATRVDGSPSDRLARTLRNKQCVTKKEMEHALRKTKMLIE